jgi:hypothetical protein
MIKILKKIIVRIRLLSRMPTAVNDIRDLLIYNFATLLKTNSTNPLNKVGRKGFSQNEEDGITLEIIKRLGLKNGTFIEIGVGNGLETNTLILAALGWRGFWIGNENLSFPVRQSQKFKYIKSFVDLLNLLNLVEKGLKEMECDSADIISIDVDGNDIYFLEKILNSGYLPKLFIIEYNAQFIPPSKFQIKYDPNFIWNRDNYFGAALQNFIELFEIHGYSLICCNLQSGSNAFFIHNKFLKYFSDVPTEINELYASPQYFPLKKYGHRQSPKVVSSILFD